MRVNDVYSFVFNGYVEQCICVLCPDGLKLEAKKMSSNYGPIYIDESNTTLQFLWNLKELEIVRKNRIDAIKKLIKMKNSQTLRKDAFEHGGHGRGLDNKMSRNSKHKLDRQVDKKRRQKQKKELMNEL